MLADNAIGEPIGWDPLDIRDSASCEYGIYIIIREDDHSSLLAENFPTFIQDVCFGTGYFNLFELESELSADDVPPRSFRPQSFVSRLPGCDEIFGNPFLPVTVEPSWLAWNGGTITKLAQAINSERTFDRLPILADALEDAGCTNHNILQHCRQSGKHGNGCWVVDLILCKDLSAAP